MSRTVVMLWLAATCLFSGNAVIADVAKWVDAHGHVHYSDRPPANVDITEIQIRHNVIDTGRNVVPTVIKKPMPQPQLPAGQTQPAVREDLRSYVENCRNNRGVDCEFEARQMIDGPAPVVFPGDPAVFPRPDLRPPPPGLTLKFSITP